MVRITCRLRRERQRCFSAPIDFHFAAIRVFSCVKSERKAIVYESPFIIECRYVYIKIN